MAKTRQKRPGPKSSKSLEDEKNEDSTEEPKTVETKKRARAVREKSKAPEETPVEPSDPLEEVGEQRKDPSVSSQVDGETPMDSDKPETNGSREEDPKDSNEGDEAFADAPSSKKDETVADSLAAPEDVEENVEDEAVADSLASPKDVDEDVEVPVKEKLLLRLVPLTQLLKPEVLDKPIDDKSKPVRKSSLRARKGTSFIEISSSSSDEPEVISSDSTSSDDDVISKSKQKRNGRSSKENNSTNAKLSNGNSRKESFKEPEMLTKSSKKAKELSINLSKMPEKVNKLMKSYRVENETQIESWSETDDFENMISTSKIDRVALKTDMNEIATETTKSIRTEKTNSKKNKKQSEDDGSEEEIKSEGKKVVKSKEKSKNSKRRKKDSEDEDSEVENVELVRKRPERSSARAAKLRTKSVIELSEKSETSSSEEDGVPLGSIKQMSKPSSSTKPSEKQSKGEDESEDQPLSKKMDDKSSSSEEKLTKKKKKKPLQDDHSEEKKSQRRRDKTSSDEEEEKKLTGKRSKAKQTKEPQRSTRNQKQTATETRSSSRKGKESKSDGLKMTFQLNKQKEPSNADESDVAESDKDSKVSSSNSIKSSLSEDQPGLEPLRLGKETSKKHLSTSESEAESANNAVLADVIAKLEKDTSDSEADSDHEIPQEEASPILDEKLRKRNKFEANNAFNVLKQKIEQRKTKRKITNEDSRTVKKNGIHSEKNNNDETSERSDPEDSSSIVNNFHLTHLASSSNPRHRVEVILIVSQLILIFFSSILSHIRLEQRSYQQNVIDWFQAVKKSKDLFVTFEVTSLTG